MRLRALFALSRATWQSWMMNRTFMWLLAFGWMIPPLIYMFVWSTAAGEQGIGGISRAGFITYYLVLILVNQLTYSQTNWTVGDLIRIGDMNKLLLRPVPPILDAFSAEIAGKAVYLVFDVPVVLLLALVLKPDLQFTTAAVLAFIPALLMAWLLRFFWGYWLALLAFWATRADALLAVQDTLIFLLAGQVAPIALLPGALQTAAVILPFRYMVGFPVEVLTGQVSGAALQSGLLIQTGWLAVSVLLSAVMWRQGLKHYTAAGG